MNITFNKSFKTEYGAFKSGDDYIFTVSLDFKKNACLKIYSLNESLLAETELVSYRVAGNVYSVCVSGLPVNGVMYEYICDDVIYTDPYMRAHSCKRAYGSSYKHLNDSKSAESALYGTDRAVICDDEYDWGNDTQLFIRNQDIISYQLHVRGFTKHVSSKVKGRGTFLGVIEKIPYLTSLGINQIEIMPSCEFSEIDYDRDLNTQNHPRYTTDKTVNADGETVDNVPTYRLNYWGYKKAFYFCPKYNYAHTDNPVKEFKDMVKALHAAGIEVIMQFFFEKNTDGMLVDDCLRYWYLEYHVDGFRLMGEKLPLNTVLNDGLLADTKLYINNLDKNDECFEKSVCRNVISVNNSFMHASRSFLKSDYDSISGFMNACRNNPERPANVNYITCYEGFTLNDLVSYEYKHNEENGENNGDGENNNMSWNCGVEGRSQKKTVRDLRLRQIKNALSLLLLSQGMPMLFMGDEMLNSQNGNNNPYCHDSDITWLNWKLNKQAEEILEYTKLLIALRKNNKILHQDNELKGMDYKSIGYPDISYHQDMAWKADFDNHMLHFGILYWGAYDKSADADSDSLYVAYNMHWSEHKFGLPRLKKGMSWEVLCTSGTDDEKVLIAKELACNTDEFTVNKRSVVVLKTVISDKKSAVKEAK